jgi:endonuclease/exonuclease/phosphatase family metal-dependent hydrolase
MIVVRVLSWNLFHGRDAPPDPALHTWRSRLFRTTESNATHLQVNRSLLAEFAEVLGRESWDIALLQEAPPRWTDELGRRTGVETARVLTSRNFAAPLRTFLAERNPDLIASNEGGSNQLLVRPPWRIGETRTATLVRRWPERRTMIWCRLEGPDGAAIAAANLHASQQSERTARQVERAAALAVEWSGETPLVFGGDLNLRPALYPRTFESLRTRFGLGEPTAPDAIDHLLARGLEVVEPPRRLEPERREVPGPGGLRIRLSDHAPVAAAFGVR